MGKEQGYRVAVLMGGISAEREISLKSGKEVCVALKEAGHDIIPFDVTARNLDGLEETMPDVAFVALHGEFGEDGQVQQMLEKKGIPYTGSGPLASRLGMDKVASKRIFVRHAVPTADYFVAKKSDEPDVVLSQGRGLGYPLVCKPADSGSSIGVSIVRGEEALLPAVQQAHCYSPLALVERYVRGRELTVGVLDGEPLPIVEIEPRREFFDYDAKYHDESTRYVTPIALIESVYRKALSVSVRAYDCLGLRHFARIDLMYGYDGKLYVLEVNTIPGLTPRSLLPMAARQAGISFVDLCDRILRMAVQSAVAERGLRKAV